MFHYIYVFFLVCYRNDTEKENQNVLFSPDVQMLCQIAGQQ